MPPVKLMASASILLKAVLAAAVHIKPMSKLTTTSSPTFITYRKEVKTMTYEQPTINTPLPAQNIVRVSSTHTKGPGNCTDRGQGGGSSTGAYEVDE
jgi:hypothetical protein